MLRTLLHRVPLGAIPLLATLGCQIERRPTPPRQPLGALSATLVSPTDAPPAEGSVRVQFTNHSADPAVAALDVRADPGYWLRPVRQRLHLFRIPPDTTIEIEAPYAFARVSPGATLRIRAGQPELQADGSLTIPEPVLTWGVTLARSPEALAFLDRFDTVATPHLSLFAIRGSPAARRLREIARERETAALAIGRLLGVAPPTNIRLAFYPDSATKTADTRHIGQGWADNGNIVEIYSDSVRVDPYHELTHLVAARLGGAPAWLDEGLATYASERMGADALALLGFPGEPVARAACRLARTGRLIPLPLLFEVAQFGGDSVPADRAYAESAALVQYLIERLGEPRFRELYRQLEAGIGQVPVERNRATLERVVGISRAELARGFEAWLAPACQAGRG